MPLCSTSRVLLVRVSLLLCFIFLVTACSSVSSLIGGRHKYDYAQNFESMQSYDFNPIIPALAADKDFLFIQSSGVMLAIENAMAAKKIRKERNMGPDFRVNYYFTGEKNITVGQLNSLFKYNLGLAWDDKYGSGLGIANSRHSFSKRTLIIDLVSGDNNRLIWRGSAPTRITREDSDNAKRKALAQAVKVILAPFPPENDFESLKTPVLDE